jgi:hypothetical protein
MGQAEERHGKGWEALKTNKKKMLLSIHLYPYIGSPKYYTDELRKKLRTIRQVGPLFVQIYKSTLLIV